MQVRDFVTKDTSILQCQDISRLERQLFLQKSGSSISLFYNILKEYNITNTSSLKGLWERELNVRITNDDWNDAWKSAKILNVCNRVRAMQLKLLHRVHISPSQRHKYNPNTSPLCPKCKIESGGLTHCLWDCRKIQQFWQVIGQEINKILSINSNNNPLYLLLGISDMSITDRFKRRLYQTLAFCARKCILLNWITDKAPSKAQWQRVVFEYVVLDHLTCKLHSNDDAFRKTWDPFLSYVGLNVSTILTRGFVS